MTILTALTKEKLIKKIKAYHFDSFNSDMDLVIYEPDPKTVTYYSKHNVIPVLEGAFIVQLTPFRGGFKAEFNEWEWDAMDKLCAELNELADSGTIKVQRPIRFLTGVLPYVVAMIVLAYTVWMLMRTYVE